MNTSLIPGSKNIRIRYAVPRNGKIEFMVQSDGGPVDTYIMDRDDIRDFDDGRDFHSYGGFRRRYEHHDRFQLPFSGSWYLLIVNRNSDSVAVSYEVY